MVGNTLKAKINPKVSPAKSPKINRAPASLKLKNFTKPSERNWNASLTTPTWVIRNPNTNCREMPIATSLQSIFFLLDEINKRN